MRSIIVPTDFSECAENAMQYAIQVAMLFNARLEIIYVQRPELIIINGLVPEVYHINIEIPDSAYRNMEELNKELNNYTPLKFETHIEKGSSLDDTVIRFAERKEAFMIIMGTKNSSDKWFDTNTSLIIAEKKVPVLAVPIGYFKKFEQHAEFVFATDFKDIHDWEIMNGFRLLAEKLHAHINVFYVRESSLDKNMSEYEHDIFKEMVKYFAGIQVEFHHSTKKNIVESVEKFALSQNASLIMMIAHERSWMGDLFHNSITKEMCLHTDVPFLSIPDKHVEINKSAVLNYW